MEGMVTAGKIGGLFGARGELSLVLYDPFPRDPNKEEPVFVEIDGDAVPLFFESFARRGVRGATAVFADIDTPERAAEFVGLPFYLRTAGADGPTSDDEIYFEDLVGWEAVIGEAAAGETGTGKALIGEAGVGVGIGVGEAAAGETRSTGSRTGRITAFFDSEFNPLLEITLDGETELIPATEDFIVAIDETRRRVTFDLPEGLLGLNYN